MDENEVVKALSALAQETRLRIFRLLIVAGREGLTPGQMSEQLNTPATALSSRSVCLAIHRQVKAAMQRFRRLCSATFVCL